MSALRLPRPRAVTRPLMYLLLALTTLLFLFPVYWVFVKFVNGPIAIFQYPPDVFPVRFSLANFQSAFHNFHLERNFLNTLTRFSHKT